MQRHMFPAAFIVLLAAGLASAEPKISFVRKQLDDKFRAEGSAVGDFNNDGKTDITNGEFWYEAPDWKMHAIVENPQEYDPAHYSHSFCNWVEDLNGDGWNDIIVVDFPGNQTWWFENPQSSAGPWKRHMVARVTNNESPTYLDIDGDGKRELICGIAPPEDINGKERQMAILRPAKDPYAPWEVQVISAKNSPGAQQFSHGLGVGDVNGDGRNDILVIEGWWEAPTPDKAKEEWKFHKAKLGPKCSQMYVFDYDGDGDNDVVSGSAHNIGVWHHENNGGGFERHDIDTTYSETHAMCSADINSDGLPDIITGKRWWSHGAKGDPTPDVPPVLFWYELTRKDGKAVWIPHEIDHASGVGTQFTVADVDGDGLLDVVTSNKKGTHYFRQVRE